MHALIDAADEKTVETMLMVFQSLTGNEEYIVAFTSTGTPLTKDDLIARVRASYAAGQEGLTKTAKELQAEIELW